MKAKYSFIHNRRRNNNLIELQIYFGNRVRRWLSTKIVVPPNAWNEKKQEVKYSYPNSVNINEFLQNFRLKYENIELDLMKKNVQFTPAHIANNANNLVEYIKKLNENKYVTEKIKLKTFKIYQWVINFLERNYPNVDITNISTDFITEIDKTLINSGIKADSRKTFHSIVKIALNDAIDNDIILVNPYKKWKMPIKITKKRTFLTVEELKLLADVQCSTNEEQVVIDRFLFSCYTGLRISDNIKIRNSDFRKINDEWFLDIITEKGVGKHLILPINRLFGGKPYNIFLKYYENNDELLFPEFHSSRDRLLLKKIVNKLDINKTVTFHVARHTCATLLAEYTANPFVIKNILGHSDIATSMRYIHDNSTMILNALNNVKWE